MDGGVLKRQSGSVRRPECMQHFGKLLATTPSSLGTEQCCENLEPVFSPSPSEPTTRPQATQNRPCTLPTMATKTTSFVTCNRCMQPLQLDETFSDEALQSSSSLSSEAGDGALTTSNYDVISTIIPPVPSQVHDQAKELAIQGQDGIPDELKKVVQLHHQQQQSANSNKEQQPLSQALASRPSQTTSPPHSHNSLSSRLALHTRLFEQASSFVRQYENDNSNSIEISHPMCLDCSDYTLQVLHKQIEEIKRERTSLKEWHKHMSQDQNADTNESEVIDKMESEIDELQNQLQQITKDLYRSEEVKNDLQEELKNLQLEEEQLELQEKDFWESHNKMIIETSQLESTRSSLQRSIENQQAILSQLNSTNVFFDAFSIGHHQGSHQTHSVTNDKRQHKSSTSSSSSSSLPTINGLRFGRVSSSSSSSSSGEESVVVDWNEINAAWGQIALLLISLKNKIGGSNGSKRKRNFDNWKIHFRGSTSYLSKINPSDTSSSAAAGEPTDQDQHKDGQEDTNTADKASEDIYELYHPGPWTPLTKILHSRRFDVAMIGILDCTSQLYSWASEQQQSGPPPRMIHFINGDKIGDRSIRLSGTFAFTSEESWSKACKYLLVNLQVLMNWATKDQVVPVPLPEH
ncbi:unnamed protein product [Sympodiomycopsis kandeliae]